MISKTNSFRDPRNPIGVLILLAALGAAAGCSTAESPSGSGTNMNHVLPSGSSVSGWLVVPSGGTHASSATLDYIANGGSSGCTECHGSDLTGGISRVSCFGNPAGCHHDPVANWATPAKHGASAKKAPGSSGFASCQICHAADFTGGGANVTCLNNPACHGVGVFSPHPRSPWLSSTSNTHTTTDPSNAPVCAQCHQAQANPGTPGCFNSTLCHGAAVHPAGWAQSSQHGSAAKAAPSASGGFSFCQTCHGTGTTPPANFGGNPPAVSCYTCHGVNAPHPAGNIWKISSTPSHRNTNQGQANVDVCAQCHRSATPGTVGCFNNTLCHN